MLLFGGYAGLLDDLLIFLPLRFDESAELVNGHWSYVRTRLRQLLFDVRLR